METACTQLQVAIVNPRIKVMEKLITSQAIDKIGQESFFLSIEDAVESCHASKQTNDFTDPCDAA